MNFPVIIFKISPKASHSSKARSRKNLIDTMGATKIKTPLRGENYQHGFTMTRPLSVFMISAFLGFVGDIGAATKEKPLPPDPAIQKYMNDTDVKLGKLETNIGEQGKGLDRTVTTISE